MGLFYEMDKTYTNLLKEKKNFIFIGEAGSGKSELVLNTAAYLAKELGKNVDVFDMDQSKPLYRSRDQHDAFAEIGVTIHYQDQFLDAPVAVGGVASRLMDEDRVVLLDIGGGHSASRVVGVYAHLLKDENSVPIYVVNPFRPWTKSVESIDGTMSNILRATRLERIYILGNPNLGYHTSAEDFLEGVEKVDELLGEFTTVRSFAVKREFIDEVKDKTDKDLFPVDLYLTYSWVDR